MTNLDKKVSDFRDNLYSMEAEGVDLSKVSEKDYLKFTRAKSLGMSKPYKKGGFERFKELITKVGKNTGIGELMKHVNKLRLLTSVYDKHGESFTPSMIIAASSGDFKNKKEVLAMLDECVKEGIVKKEGKCRFSFTNSKKNVEAMILESTPKYSNELEEAFTEDDFATDYYDSLQKEIKKYKKFVVVTAVMDKLINVDFVKSIKNFAKRNNALVLVLPSDIKNSKKKKGGEDLCGEENEEKAISLDPRLKEFKIVFKDLYLNNNLCISSIKTSAKQIKTLTGLDRIATKKNASIIVAGTKLFEDEVPTQKGKIPLRIVTTGAVTESNYDTDKYMSKRTAYLAEEDHMFGAAVVDIIDDSLFQMRLVEGSKNNTFTDLGVEYNPDGTINCLGNNTVVLGDSHVEKINAELNKSIMSMVDDMYVDTLVVHDLFNATSITHHDKNKNLTRAMKALEDKVSLKAEGEKAKEYLENLRNHVDNIVVVNSNHDRHLETYLEEGRYIGDPINSYMAHKLAIAYMEEKNPLKYLIEDELKLNGKGIKWLKQDEGFNKYGVECGMHGDSGCNGARGSIVTFEKALGNCVTAHTHSAKRLRRACCVGVVGELDQGYNKGLTTWTHTVCIIYSNGTKQLVHFIPDKEGNYNFKG